MELRINSVAEKPFYEDGLRFSCRRCSLCCRQDEGFVFLTKNDADVLSAAVALRYEEFIQVYCRWVKLGGGVELLCLKEKTNNDCCFWKDGCSVYHTRPLQCRSYPFWKNFLADKKLWDKALSDCPGVGVGELHSKASIEAWIQSEDAEPVIQRRHRRLQPCLE
ncbi:MAG: YkgJ family cysteine cluster protein [Spirochaetaceae bacterium]|jgi:Fe-S-cluster containining protein|nr:YkgJ family cysteine cluster protein [Spirochaetaceae bacterium]